MRKKGDTKEQHEVRRLQGLCKSYCEEIMGLRRDVDALRAARDKWRSKFQDTIGDCGATHPLGFYCNRPGGHRGKHIAIAMDE